MSQGAEGTTSVYENGYVGWCRGAKSPMAAVQTQLFSKEQET